MKNVIRSLLVVLLVLTSACGGCGPRRVYSGILIRGGRVVDGSGGKGRLADVRITADRIREIGSLKPGANELVIDARGMVVCPGFIDTHSHADSGILGDPGAATAIRQGITTAIGGQDGSSRIPLSRFFESVEKKGIALNLASFVGHGSVRSEVLRSDFKRPSTPEETARMRALVQREMESGSLGLSSGLEYDPGHYAATEELIECAKGAQGGIYISHMRNEDNQVFDSINELIRIARESGIPAQISHIKLGSSSVWNRAGEVLKLMESARKQHVEITADVYPYLYWQSTITVLIPTREWSNRALWEKGLADVGGPGHVLLSSFSPDKSWAGQTIEEICKSTGKDPVSLIQEIVSRTHGPEGSGSESVIVTAMTEADLRAFIADKHIMFCTDGGLLPSHPRGAGSFPRILGKYVREEKVITLEEAIRKMTSLPAKRMGFPSRGLLKPGYFADVVIFDPARITDTATTKDPRSPPIGLPYVIVNGRLVLEGGNPTGERPGRVIRRTLAPSPPPSG